MAETPDPIGIQRVGQRFPGKVSAYPARTRQGASLLTRTDDFVASFADCECAVGVGRRIRGRRAVERSASRKKLPRRLRGSSFIFCYIPAILNSP